MRMSRLFSHTLREAPSQAVLPHHKLLTRAGYIQEIGKGGFAWLPLGRMALQQIASVFFKQLQLPTDQVELPLLQAHEGSLPSDAGLHIDDPQGRRLLLASKLNNTFYELAHQHLSSYKQMPASLFYHGPLWDAQVHPADGLFYARMPQTLELFAGFGDAADRAAWQERFQINITQLLKACDVAFIQTETAAARGQLAASEWYFPHPAGRSIIFSCPHCSYTASEETARFYRQPFWQEEALPLEEAYTPDCKTIEALAQYLHIPKERTAKAVFLMAAQAGKERLLIVIVPGDRDLDERRLVHTLDLNALRPATEEEIEASGIVPGYGSPVGIADAFTIVDAQIPLSSNLVAGANRSGYHFVNVNYGRDYSAQLIAEITHPKDGDLCPHCSLPMQTTRTVLLARLERPEIEHGVMNPQGEIIPLESLICRLYTGRLLAASAESHNDEYGLQLPAAVAPFPVHLVLLQDKEGLAQTQADEIEGWLLNAGLEPLFDNRTERAGVKFNDADLIGIPLRITISQRALSQGGVEVKPRNASEPILTALDEIIPLVKQMLV